MNKPRKIRVCPNCGASAASVMMTSAYTALCMICEAKGSLRRFEKTADPQYVAAHKKLLGV